MATYIHPTHVQINKETSHEIVIEDNNAMASMMVQKLRSDVKNEKRIK